ncbi:XapX domain-containing protein [Streptomyces sp. NBC_00510]
MRSLLSRCLLSFSVGALAGVLYWLMGVMSPAPPWISLAGLLGILAGEAATRHLLTRRRKRPADPAEGPPPASP